MKDEDALGVKYIHRHGMRSLWDGFRAGAESSVASAILLKTCISRKVFLRVY